jgi:hypothetical protein
MKHASLLALSVVLVIPALCAALAAAPASAPVTQPRRVSIPPGFKVVTVNGRRAMVEAAEEPWVTAALGKVPATTKPATQPAAMLEKLRAERENIIRAMMVDLATNDPVPLAKDYDTVLTPQLRKLDALRPPIYFIVTTPDRLSAVMRAGWDDPHFHYNRIADVVSFNPNIPATTEDDDLIFPVMFDPKDAIDKRSDSLNVQVNSIDASIAASIDTRARQVLGTGFAQLVNNTTFEPLKLKEDQAWLGIGVSTILAAKYTAMVTGEDRKNLVAQLIYEHPQHPLKMSAVNLLKPSDLKLMRPELVGLYLDTVRRKSSRAVQYLVQEGGGDAAIAKAVAAVRDKKPATGEALVKEIQDATKVDLTPLLTS